MRVYRYFILSLFSCSLALISGALVYHSVLPPTLLLFFSIGVIIGAIGTALLVRDVLKGVVSTLSGMSQYIYGVHRHYALELKRQQELYPAMGENAIALLYRRPELNTLPHRYCVRVITHEGDTKHVSITRPEPQITLEYEFLINFVEHEDEATWFDDYQSVWNAAQYCWVFCECKHSFLIEMQALVPSPVN